MKNKKSKSTLPAHPKNKYQDQEDKKVEQAVRPRRTRPTTQEDAPSPGEERAP